MHAKLAALSLLFASLATACAGAAPASAPARTHPLFEFHDDPWVNLHQRLVAEATANRYWHVDVPIPTCACARGVEHEWSAAVAAYGAMLGGPKGRSTVFDDDLVRTNLAFALAGASPTLPDGVDPDIAKVIAPVFPAYLRAGWPIDDARNRAWIADVEPLVARWGPDIAAELARRLETTWPARPIRVEVAEFAGFGGAYTVGDPILTTMSSEDAGYRAPAALEMLFHEASHGLDSVIDHDLQMAFIARGKREPRGLDHAIIFYTAGALVRKRLGPSYVPYAYAQGVWARGWQGYEAALRTSWQAWIDDRIDLGTALDRLADALGDR